MCGKGGEGVEVSREDWYEWWGVWWGDGKEIGFGRDGFGNRDVFVMDIDMDIMIMIMIRY